MGTATDGSMQHYRQRILVLDDIFPDLENDSGRHFGLQLYILILIV